MKYYFAITDKKTAHVHRTDKTDIETCLKLILDVKEEFPIDEFIIEIYSTPGKKVLTIS